jgi:hypothetical protein
MASAKNDLPSTPSSSSLPSSMSLRTASLRSSARSANALPLAGLVERREAVAVFLPRAAFGLSALILQALDEWRPDVVALLPAVVARELAVDEDRRA